MIPSDDVVWLKLVGQVIQTIRSFRAFMRGRRRKLVFVKRSFSGWASGQAGQQQVIHLRCQFAVTNWDEQDAVIVVRVRVGRGVLSYGRALQDCYFCDVGDERVGPFSTGAKIRPHTTALTQINHPFVVERLPRPRTEMLSFRIVLTDQFNKTHSKRIRVGKLNPNPIPLMSPLPKSP